MEMNHWGEDFSLGLELELDMFDLHNGQFGDLKVSGQPMSDRSLQANLDALFVKQWDDSNQNDDLGSDWMESSDIDFYLDALNSAQDLQPDSFTAIYDCPDTVITEGVVKEVKPSDLILFESQFLGASLPDAEIFEASHPKAEFFEASPPGAEFFEASPPGAEFFEASPPGAEFFEASSPDAESDVKTSLPSSPAQVAPVIVIDSVQAYFDCHTGSPESYQNSLETTDSTLESFPDQDLSFDDSETVTINNTFDFLNVLPSTTNRSLASRATASNKKGRINIIHSSPELYKVISASAVESGKKHSSLGKSKCGKSSAPRKGKTPAQPVPEYVIVEQLNKKDRKKMQNKNAAIRYRQKKKEEAHEIKSEEQILEELNSKLKLKVEDLQREIKYMKNLMDDVRKAKGLL